MSKVNTRGSLSHHQARHAPDSGKALDQLFEKVMLGVLVLVALIGVLVYVV